MNLIVCSFSFKICFNQCQSMFICQLVKSFTPNQNSIQALVAQSLHLVSLLLKCSSHVQRLYRSSTLSCIQCHIHQASHSSINLYPAVCLSIKTLTACLLTFQVFYYSLKHFGTLFLCHLRSILFVFRVFNFIVLLYASFRIVLVVQFLLEIFSIFVSFWYSLRYG